MSSEAPAPRLLLASLHLLMVSLLVMVCVRSFQRPAHNGMITGTAILMGAVYATGAWVPLSQGSRWARIWLTALCLSWLALLLLTPDAIYLCFPLYLLQLFLLRGRYAELTVAATAVVAVLGYLIHAAPSPSPDAFLGPAISAVFAIGAYRGIQRVHRESERRRELIVELNATRAELSASQHQAGALAERERLAREIHDTLAQGLSSIQLLLTAAEQRLPRDAQRSATYIEQARLAAKHNLDEARRFVQALTPPDLVGQTLPAALARLCANATLAVRFNLDGTPITLPTPFEAALLRIAQSALANTVQHASANRVEMTLSYMNDQITLDVVDDGLGFDQRTVSRNRDRGFGLAGMRARALELGGEFTVESSVGHGTALAVSFPIRQEAL